MLVRTEGHFCASHILTEHNGLCSNLHGHNYKVVVKVNFPDFDCSKEMFPVDFAVLKKSMLGIVIDNLDHAFLFGPKTDSELVDLVMFKGYRYYEMGVEPTAEGLVISIAKQLLILFSFEKEFDSADFLTVQVWESDTSYAEVCFNIKETNFS